MRAAARGGRSWIPGGVNTTAFTTYSRDYFSPRGERRRLAPRALSLAGCSCSPRFIAFTQAGGSDFSAPGTERSGIEQRRVERAHISIRDEDGAKTDPKRTAEHRETPFPSLDPLPAQLQSKPSYFLPVERERGKEIALLWELRRLSIVIRGARSFSSPLPSTEGKNESCTQLAERNLPRYRNLFVATPTR